MVNILLYIFLSFHFLNIYALNLKDIDFNKYEKIFQKHTADEELKKILKNSMHIGVINISKKNRDAKNLLRKGSIFFKHNSLYESCYAFKDELDWRDGDLYIAVYDQFGNCYSSLDKNLIWKNISKIETPTGNLLSDFISGNKSYKTLIYKYKNDFKISHIKILNKNNIKFILEVGFYPHNRRYKTKYIAKNIANYINNHGIKKGKFIINNRLLDFFDFNINISLYDNQGKCLADISNKELVGHNLINYKDENGTYYIKNIINSTKNKKGSGWTIHGEENSKKLIYSTKCFDKKSKKTFIVSTSYYTKSDLKHVKLYVKNIIRYIKKNGIKFTFSQFYENKKSLFLEGFRLRIYDLNGNCKVDNKEPNLINQNLLHYTDDDGNFIIQEIISNLKNENSTIISYKLNNQHMICYAHKIDVDAGKFIVSCDFSTESKSETLQLLINKASKILQNYNTTESFFRFNKKNSFLIGDIDIFVYKSDGTLLFNKKNKQDIFKNFINIKDNNNEKYIQKIVDNTLKNDIAWTQYYINNGTRIIFSKVVEKNNNKKYESFIVGGGYFL